ncbi:carbohydrate kinase family protein [Anaerotruncus colihominis]|uniref:Carbohydrate kinase n=1 Tax=Anaerotruncus colihominis TaxID=169435 RepID=A0A845SXC3_9FIRM|nr:carbohydrate kinase [Anaerotruncus colihominis]MCR2026849.1 carbohydrate kinase [Anaerotruncus colihominis]NDO39578.1 carbohydrate kinase [Anaerotruncus colihominis]
MIDVTALGELLIDFTPAGRSQQGNNLFEQNPGGAPANVLTAVTRLGKKAAFISAVGNDQFGRALIEVVDSLGIDTSGIQVKEDAFTTLAFVHLNESGDRSFSFARKPGADQCIEAGKIDYSLIDRCRIFHFGSVALSDEPARSATLSAARYAFEHGKLVSYDPNWRPVLWNSTAQGIAGMKLGLPYTNVLKLSEEELELLSGTTDLEQGTKKLFCGAMKLIVVTLGPRGCFYRCGDQTGAYPTYHVKVVDTTGAGDAFWGALLCRLLDQPSCLEGDSQALADALNFANAAGSLCAAGRGAIPSIPTNEQITAFRLF